MNLLKSIAYALAGVVAVLPLAFVSCGSDGIRTAMLIAGVTIGLPWNIVALVVLFALLVVARDLVGPMMLLAWESSFCHEGQASSEFGGMVYLACAIGAFINAQIAIRLIARRFKRRAAVTSE